MQRGVLAALLVVATACTTSPDGQAGSATTMTQTATSSTPLEPATTVASETTTTVAAGTTTTVAASTTTADPFARPDWLGTRPLSLRPDGHGVAQPTPPELEDRRLATVDLLTPPEGDEFAWTMEPVPADVLARSSWGEGCPVSQDELTYLTLSHYGFDGRFHTGEMIVNTSVAEDVVDVFRQLHEARFPIEQMRVIAAEEIDAHPTGDGNDTTSFVCRPAVGSSSWSQHAYGLAVDINPFHNPYVKGDLVLPELASSYLDRADVRPGMIVEGDVVTRAFDAIGWGWGGRWGSLDDWMHFSLTGR